MTQISNFRPRAAKFIVTGGAGFIGSHLVYTLLREGAEVIVIDDFSAGLSSNLKRAIFKLHTIDISNWSMLKRACDDGRFEDVDGVFHLAAEARIQPSIADPRRTFEVNAQGTFNVLEMMRICNISNIVYSASSSTYGLANKPPLKETMRSNCLNPYAATKLIGEELCKSYGNCYDLNTVCLKYFNVYGERSPIHLKAYSPVIGLFFRQALESHGPLTVVGDGQQKRDFTHVSDVVNANLFAMDKLLRDGKKAKAWGKTLNIGTGDNHTILQIAEKVRDALKKERPDLKIEHIAARPGEARETLADNSKAKELLDWEPAVSLDKGIELLKPHYCKLFNL